MRISFRFAGFVLTAAVLSRATAREQDDQRQHLLSPLRYCLDHMRAGGGGGRAERITAADEEKVQEREVRVSACEVSRINKEYAR